MTGASVLPRRTAVIVFLAFAFAYFLSALVRAVTATLAPTLAQEFSLHASDLGLLSEEYDTVQNRQVGNTPQALTHLALVRAATAIDQATLAQGPTGKEQIARLEPFRG